MFSFPFVSILRSLALKWDKFHKTNARGMCGSKTSATYVFWVNAVNRLFATWARTPKLWKLVFFYLVWMFWMGGFPRSELRTHAKRGLLRRSWPLPHDRGIPERRHNLESNVSRAHQSRTRPASLTNFIWPVMRPLPLTAGHPRREQIATARSGSNPASHHRSAH